MSKYYSVPMTAIYSTPASRLPSCRALLEFLEPQENEAATQGRAGHITEIAFTDSLERKDIQKLSYEVHSIENPSLTGEPDRVIEGIKAWLFPE